MGVVGVGQDITSLKVKENELSNVAADLRALIDTANAPIFGITREGLVNEWNNKAAEITGFVSGDVMGRDLVENFITEDYRCPSLHTCTLHLAIGMLCGCLRDSECLTFCVCVLVCTGLL